MSQRPSAVFLETKNSTEKVDFLSISFTFPRENRLFRSNFLLPETQRSASGTCLTPLLLLSTPTVVLKK